MASSSEDSPSQDGFAIIDTPPRSSRSAEADAEATPPGDGNPSQTPTTSPATAKPNPREEALSNRDIMALIFTTFLPSTPTPLDAADRKFFLDLALQCRSFSEPALDCLWRHLRSLIPLIRLLPMTVLIEGKYYLSGSADGLTNTFRSYAMRVRSLRIAEEKSPGLSHHVDPSVYVSLTRLLGSASLLPGLKTLHFELTTEFFASWHILPILLPCQSLTEIVLGGAMMNSELSRRVTLPHFVSHAQSLRSLTVSDEADIGQSLPGSFLKHGIFQFQHLKVLNYTTPRTASLSQIWGPPQISLFFISELGRNLRLLQQLELDLVLPVNHYDASALVKKKEGVSTNLKVSSTSTVQRRASAAVASSLTQEESSAIQDLFPNLRHLALCHRSDSNVMKCYFISSLIHNVAYLTLTLRSSWIPTFSTIVDALAPCPFLQCLTLKETDAVSLTVSHVSLLLAHLNLDQLHLNLSLLRQLPQDDSESPSEGSAENCLGRILTAATGLQEDPEPLRCLTLPIRWENADADLTLLMSVAGKAPDMQSICMSIDSSLTVSKIPTLLSLICNPKIPRESTLKYLEIHDFRTGDVPFSPGEYKTIAQYIDTCFPNLMSVKLTSSSNPFVKDHWMLIEQLRVMQQENRRLSVFAQAQRFRVSFRPS